MEKFNIILQQSEINNHQNEEHKKEEEFQDKKILKSELKKSIELGKTL